MKESVPILVCIGNPPYDRHAAATDDTRADTGAWVRWGEAKDGKDAILNDFIDPVKAAGKGGDLKNLYNLYVYFWRWGLWKSFEHELARGPGVVSYITASSFLDGSAFLGVRKHMRELCDEIWIIDLGGEGRGTRRDENVFAIQTPVAVTVAVRYRKSRRDTPAAVHYCRLDADTRRAKLDLLDGLNTLDDLVFELCPEDWNASFRPAGQGTFFDWPLLTDLMPWQHSGVQGKRIWPIGTSKKVLETRWQTLLSAQNAERAIAFKESTDRQIGTSYSQFWEEYEDERPLSDLPALTDIPPISQYGYRSFDRHFLIADGRLLSRPRPQLWQSHSDHQIYLASVFTQPLGVGPALTTSAHVPDLHYFRGSFGAKDIFPLYRDAAATQPNLHPSLLASLEGQLSFSILPEDFAAYVYAVLAQPTYCERFADELNSREVRVPISLDSSVFDRAVTLGRELLFLHTYGERFAEGQTWPKAVVKCHVAVPAGSLPENFSFDPDQGVIDVGGGQFGPVSPGVWDYEVSGLKVVQSWLGYRMKKRKGKASSPLDEIRPSEWTGEFNSELLRLLNLLTRTLEIHIDQAELLDAVLTGPLLQAADLGEVPELCRKAPKTKAGQAGFDY